MELITKADNITPKHVKDRQSHKNLEIIILYALDEKNQEDSQNLFFFLIYLFVVFADVRIIISNKK